MARLSSGLRDSIILSDDGECSDTLYIRGFVREMSDEALIDVLLHYQPTTTSPESAVPVVTTTTQEGYTVDLTERQGRNVIWLKCPSEEDAEARLQALNQAVIHGKVLSVKYELGRDPITGKVRVPGNTHNTVIRRVLMSHSSSSVEDSGEYCPPCKLPRLLTSSSTHKKLTSTSSSSSTAMPTYNYSHKSIFFHVSHPLPAHGNNVMTLELPYPSGLYLTRLIQLTKTTNIQDPLLQLLLNHRNDINPSKYPKEISEAMAMVDALQRTLKHLQINYHPLKREEHDNKATKQSTKKNFTRFKVYVLGDGKIPLAAAALCLHLPSHFSFHSIDPILVPLEIPSSVEYASRFHQHAVMSQDYSISDDDEVQVDLLSIVVACHSHAPLQEFWDRIKTAKVAITMPCCANYSDLQIIQNITNFNVDGGTREVMSFEDFEVYSAKRIIHIYESL